MIAAGDLVLNTTDIYVSTQLKLLYNNLPLKFQMSGELEVSSGMVGLVIDSSAGLIQDMAIVLFGSRLVAVWKDRLRPIVETS